MERKPFNYFAIRVMNTVIFRRTVAKVKKVRSVLYKPNTEFRLEQVTYTGGKVVGSMPYAMWVKHGGGQIKVSACISITRELFKAMGPYIQKGDA